MSEGHEYEPAPSDIAIVGMACRFTNCRTVEEFWKNIDEGVECIHQYTDEELIEAGVNPALLSDPDYVRAGGHLHEVGHFDAGFFGFSPKDAGIMDPQHRHFYECAWEAMERAGHTSKNFPGAIGVYAGSGMTSYFMNNVMTNPDLVRSTGMFLLRHTGNDRDFLPTGISYNFNLTGPSVAVQTACSTSLVATHMACQSLLNGECDMALAGGATIDVPHGQGYIFRPGEVLSPDGHCRSFDAQSAGTVLTSGVGVVLLRRLEDALEDGDHIHAIIKGSAINNDGSGKVGFLAPSVDGHAAVVAEALAVAGLEAEDISYIETHGTGTAVGDPIEITALTEAFRQSTERTQFCPIGSVKATIGHTDTAAGVASLIKVVEALKHRTLPKSLNYDSPNPRIDFERSPFFVNDRRRDWETDGAPRRAGVSSLGVGGTNAHVVVEEAPPGFASDPARSGELLVLSAKTPSALDARTDDLAAHLRANPDLNLSDLAYTLQTGREPFEHRRVVAVCDLDDAASALESRAPQRVASGKAGTSAPSIVFMFPGGGAQYPNMGRGLYETEPEYKAAVDECLTLLAKHVDLDLRSLMFPAPGEEDAAAEQLRDVTASICSIFITSYATAKLWMSKGYDPEAMTGHSLGEYVAACLARVFSLDDALKIVALRGRMLKKVPAAAMLSIALPANDVRELIGADLDLSAINGPELCLVSGPDDQIDELAKTLEAREVDCRKLHIAAASHCRLIEPILDEFRAGLAGIAMSPPQRRFICNVTGTWARPEDVADAEYWVRHFRQPVLFSDGLAELLADPNRVMLEVGPGTTLCSLARQQPTRPGGIVSSLRHPTDEASDAAYFLTALGRLWIAGVDIDWKAHRGDERRRRLPLPTYPFERQRYWIEPGTPVAPADTPAPLPPIRKHESMDDWFYRRSWKASEVGAATEDVDGSTLVFADASGLGSEVACRLRDAGRDVILVREGDAFYRFSDDEYALAPEEGRAGYDQLLAALAEQERLPRRIVHCWMVTAKETFRPGSSFFHRNQERGYYSLVFLMQALGELDYSDDLHIDVISNGMQAVGDEPARYPDKATLLGPVRVIPHEFGNVTARSVDVELPTDGRGRSDGDMFDQLAASIVAECRADGTCELIAYRDGARLTEDVEPAPLRAAEESRFRNGGVYLITGGLGGIGLAMAEYLATTYRAKLVLLGRSELPHSDDWDSWLESHGERDRTSIRLRAIRHLQELGAEVLPAAGDVANIERMQAVIAEAIDRFGRINGVIHAAAVIDDGVIQAKTVEDMEQIFTPKVHGTLLLAELFRDVDLDFFVLFSSTSAILGPAGQCDYVAANCFLDALASTKGKAKRKFVAIEWGVWTDVGAGRDLAQRMKGLEVDGDYLHERLGHPLLDERLLNEPDETLFSTALRTSDHWLLHEHRTKSGQALIPGTGYLELARGVFAETTGDANVEIRDLSFFAPLTVGDNETREMRIALKREGDQFAMKVSSRSVNGSAGPWTTNATGSVRSLSTDTPPALDVAAIRTRCPREDDGAALKQSSLLAFGPRWDVLKSVRFGTGEALATLQLPADFSDDLDAYRLHPALLDLATGYALPLLDGYEQSDSLFVPLSYGRVRMHSPLPSRVVSHVRSDPGNSIDQEIASFDIVIADELGQVLVEVERFTVKKMANTSVFATADLDAAPVSGHAHLSQGEKLFLENLEHGILADEGMAALERVLAAAPLGGGNMVCVSSIDLPLLIEREGEIQDTPEESGIKFDRPDLQSEFEAPRDAIEKTLAEYWEDLLGVSDIGINDDFFELGGHSLIAVRLFAKIKKQWSVEYPISVLFQAPTIATGADLLREELGVVLGDDRPAEPRAAKPAFKHLVPMTKIDRTDKPPFFLVAGMFGNVLNLRHLAAHMGDDQTVYAIQARGLHGDEKPHNRFADMARDGIEAIRSIQPEGPYFIGGFSGGGITAFEMAQQLKAQGEKIGILVMLDTPAKERPSIGKLDVLKMHWDRLRSQGLGYFSTWLKNRIAWEKQKRTRTTRDLTPAEFRSEEIELGFRTALAHYQTQSYDGKVFLYRPPLEEAHRLSGGRVINRYRDVMDNQNHWKPFIKGGIEVHVVSGDHDGMVLEPHVRVLAGKLKTHLAEAQRGAREAIREVQPAPREERRDDAFVPAAQSF